MILASKSLHAQGDGELEREKKRYTLYVDDHFKDVMDLKFGIRRLREEVREFISNKHIDGLQVRRRKEQHIDLTFSYKCARLTFVMHVSYPFKPPAQILVDNDIDITSLAGKNPYFGFDPMAYIRTGEKSSIKVSDYIVQRFGCNRPLFSSEMVPLCNMLHNWTSRMQLKDTFECLFNLYTAYTFIRHNLLQTEKTPPCIHRCKRKHTGVSTNTSEDK
jgi:hypothetical protein